MNMDINSKLELACDCYQKGCTCSQAVIAAFIEEIGIDESTALRLFEGFGGGVGGMQNVCGAFSAAASVLSYYVSNGDGKGSTKVQTYKIIREAAEIFEKEYGSVICKEILHGNSPKAFQCGMKVKDAILLTCQMIDEIENNSI